MKHRVFFLTVVSSMIVFLGSCTAGKSGDSKDLLSRPLFHKDGLLTEESKTFFGHLGVAVETLADANNFAQKNLLRVGERWDKQKETDLQVLMRKNEDLLIDELRSFGMIDEVKPLQKSYTYALLMGALKSSVALRLDYLVKLEQQGYIFETIVLLGGERELRGDEKLDLPAGVSTEAQMMSYLCAQHPQLKDKKVLLVNAPMVKKEDGSLVRPTTDSTLVYFAKIASQQGSCLVISHNPYTVRQTKVTKRILDQSKFPTQGAGAELQKDRCDSIILMDEFARTLYEEQLQYKEDSQKK